MDSLRIIAKPLDKEAFAPFGDVIEMAGAENFPVNDGHATRYNDLAIIDVDAENGHPVINIFRAAAWPQPLVLRGLERHPLGSQTFYPLQDRPYLIVVGPGERPQPGSLLAFLARGDQGVNYRRNVWHHPLLALRDEHDFLVIERGGGDGNLEVIDWPGELVEVDH